MEILHNPVDLEAVLKQSFGLEQFRLGQREILESVLEKKDVLAVMPTGQGKSLCFQLPTCLEKGITLVISPLVALMRDQVLQLKAIGIPSGYLYAAQSMAEKRAIFQEMKNSSFFLLYLSPERLQKEGFVRWFRQAPVALIAIDEAHCISKWGPDFREDYYRLGQLRIARPEIPILALTASATPEVLFDIKKQLKLVHPRRHVYGFYRPNLFYQVEFCLDESEKLAWIHAALQKNPTGRVIIYAGTRKRSEELVQTLKGGFPDIDFYHAGLPSNLRNQKQDDFDKGRTRILCATNAFGMGVHCPDIRLVIHERIPANIESYYQEVGRAGRDGKPSTCLLLYSPRDKGLHSYFIRTSEADADTLNRRWRSLEVMIQFAEGGECRHGGILTYFRDVNKIESCGHCDVCAPGAEAKIQRTFFASVWNSLKAGDAFRQELRSRKPRKQKRDFSNLPPFNEIESERLKILKNWRKEYAQKQKIPAFLVFSNKTLDDLVRKWPQSSTGLESVYGIGPQKLDAFGKPLLEVIQKTTP